MPAAEPHWRLIPEERRAGSMNMALDEVAAETVSAGGPSTLRVYRWDPSTLSLGYHQAVGTVDLAFCEAEGIDVVRRPTGGGGIYHDVDADISYSIVAPAEAFPSDLTDCYHALLEPVFDAFDRLGIPAGLADGPRPAVYTPACYLREIDPAHDVVVDGRKISGNAQYRQRDAVIQHGSITYSRATERHLATFADPGVTPADFEDRVTSIHEQSGTARRLAVEAIEDALADWAGAETGAWTPGELSRAGDLSTTKFADDAWTHRR